MTPTARSELRSYTKRIRKESKLRDRQFAPRNVDTSFVVGVVLGLAFVAIAFIWWAA